MTQDQPRGSREAYERLSDPAMYWTQIHGEPIREPIRESGPRWQHEPEPEETRSADILPYAAEEEPAYDDRRYPAEQPTYEDRRYRSEEVFDAQEQFGGVNWGAGFFGWLVAVGFAVVLTAAAGVALAVLSRTVDAVPSLAEAEPRTAAFVAAALGVTVLMVAYYVGGYVAGRMSRFDGGRQGAGVWVTGILLTTLAGGVGLFLGSEYDAFDRFDLPDLPLPAGSLGLVGLAGAVVALLGSLLAAVGGGKVGCRYHQKVDEYL